MVVPSLTSAKASTNPKSWASRWFAYLENMIRTPYLRSVLPFDHNLGGPQSVRQTFVKELALWAHLSHDNVLPFYGVFLRGESNRICLVSPWMKNGNLRDYLQRTPGAPRLPFVRTSRNLPPRDLIHCRSPIPSKDCTIYTNRKSYMVILKQYVLCAFDLW